ncbi:MAG: 30S ribosomal protein S2 [Patescibacteria group bacterium]
MLKLPSLAEMLDAGVHFGHRESKAHPKMKPYVYTVSNGVQVINLAETARELKKATDFVTNLAKEGKTVLFLGTKAQVKKMIEENAQRAELPYVVNRWIGGTMTNFEMVSKQIKKFKKMLKESTTDAWDKYTKKEKSALQEEMEKLQRIFGGVQNLEKTPDAIFLIDCRREKNAFAEAIKCRIPIIALVDTNTNPEKVAYPIPANDDGVNSLKMIIKLIADAYIDGKNEAKK